MATYPRRVMIVLLGCRAALGITDPVKHLASGILFQPVESERQAKYIKFWEESKAL